MTAAFAVGATACGEPLPNTCKTTNRVSSSQSALYFAADAPAVVQLSKPQQEAILAVEPVLGPAGYFCTATLVAPGWVLTAAHCNLGGGMIVQQGLHRSSPMREMYASEIWVHDTEDVALLRIPIEDDMEPLALFSEALDAQWVGTIVQLAGYGQDETKKAGARRYVASALSSLDDVHLDTDGGGKSGACIGDSGSPLLVLGHDGLPKVAGVLSSGSSTCVDIDRYTRVDRILAWAAEHIGSFVPEPQECGLANASGRCQAGWAIWCEDAAGVRAEQCLKGTACGWSPEATGVRCVAADDDPCGGVDAFGACDQNTAVRCSNGAIQDTHCSACARRCGRDPATGQATCLD